MLERVEGGGFALVCDVAACGLRGPVHPSAGEAVTAGVEAGWDVVHLCSTCPHCSETGALGREMLGTEDYVDEPIVVRIVGGEVDPCFN